MQDPTLFILSKAMREHSKQLNYNLQLPRGRDKLKSNLIVDVFLFSPLTLSSGMDKHNKRQLNSKRVILETETSRDREGQKELCSQEEERQLQCKAIFRKAGI